MGPGHVPTLVVGHDAGVSELSGCARWDSMEGRPMFAGRPHTGGLNTDRTCHAMAHKEESLTSGNIVILTTQRGRRPWSTALWVPGRGSRCRDGRSVTGPERPG